MDKYCTHCGQKLAAEDRVCPKCGEKADSEITEAITAAEEQADFAADENAAAQKDLSENSNGSNDVKAHETAEETTKTEETAGSNETAKANEAASVKKKKERPFKLDKNGNPKLNKKGEPIRKKGCLGIFLIILGIFLGLVLLVMGYFWLLTRPVKPEKFNGEWKVQLHQPIVEEQTEDSESTVPQSDTEAFLIEGRLFFDVDEKGEGTAWLYIGENKALAGYFKVKKIEKAVDTEGGEEEGDDANLDLILGIYTYDYELSGFVTGLPAKLKFAGERSWWLTVFLKSEGYISATPLEIDAKRHKSSKEESPRFEPMESMPFPGFFWYAPQKKVALDFEKPEEIDYVSRLQGVWAQDNDEFSGLIPELFYFNKNYAATSFAYPKKDDLSVRNWKKDQWHIPAFSLLEDISLDSNRITLEGESYVVEFIDDDTVRFSLESDRTDYIIAVRIDYDFTCEDEYSAPESGEGE